VSQAVAYSAAGVAPVPALRSLRKKFKGAVIEPGRAGWEGATQAYNTAFVQEPALVALPTDAQDVSTIVRFAAEHELQVAAQRTGHNAEPLGTMDDVVLVKTDGLKGVEIDVNRRVARVASGSKWRDVVPKASELGLAALHGSTGDVSVAGYSLGGGVGWYGRKHGLSTNSVLAIELVTADGQLRRVDQENEPDLFWALRGGGGNFGVVTALEVQLYPISEVYAGMVFYPWERASEVLHTWFEWTHTVPEEVTSVGRILQFPPIEELPETFRGRQFAAVDAVVIGDEAFGREQLRALKELGPEIDTFAMTPPAGIAELHMDPPEPLPYTMDGMMLGELDGAGIDRFLEVAGPGSGSPLVIAEIRHVGGAFARPQAHHGALASFDAAYLTLGVGMAFDEPSYQASHGQLEKLAEAFAPYTNGREYLNFIERPTDPSRFYTPVAYRRLRKVKGQYDPQNLFRANHPIPPAS
jgi:FAD/FMN-containing dehydrogenase